MLRLKFYNLYKCNYARLFSNKSLDKPFYVCGDIFKCQKFLKDAVDNSEKTLTQNITKIEKNIEGSINMSRIALGAMTLLGLYMFNHTNDKINKLQNSINKLNMD